jgi:Cu-Zn family superoxide dismutase
MKIRTCFLTFLLFTICISCGEGRDERVTKAKAVLTPTRGNEVLGEILFEEVSDGVKISGRIKGLTPGKHGFHIHEKGDCSSPDASSAGEHYNPHDHPHASRESQKRHLGDLGNIEADSQGVAVFEFIDSVIKLQGKNSILEKSVIIHEKADDFITQPTGGAGSRLSCGVILPFEEEAQTNP